MGAGAGSTLVRSARGALEEEEEEVGRPEVKALADADAADLRSTPCCEDGKGMGSGPSLGGWGIEARGEGDSSLG